MPLFVASAVLLWTLVLLPSNIVSQWAGGLFTRKTLCSSLLSCTPSFLFFHPTILSRKLSPPVILFRKHFNVHCLPSFIVIFFVNCLLSTFDLFLDLSFCSPGLCGRPCFLWGGGGRQQELSHFTFRLAACLLCTYCLHHLFLQGSVPAVTLIYQWLILVNYSASGGQRCLYFWVVCRILSS